MNKVSAKDNLTISQRNKRSKTLRNEIHNSLPIPVDLIFEIFSRLPPKSIARCRCVSKPWASMLRRQDFTELYLTRSHAHPRLLFSCDKMLFLSTPYNKVQNLAINHRMQIPCARFPKFRGCVHGFVCFAFFSIRFGIVVCNPTTGQYIHCLPKLKKTRTSGFNTFFGYDPIEKQYKVLYMTLDKVSEEHQILTLGTRKHSWRRIQCGIPHHHPLHRGVCINGVLYYLAADMGSGDSIIVCFDIRSEKFRLIKLMELAHRRAIMVNYNGKLALLMSDKMLILQGTSKSFEMSILEDTENHKWSKHVYELPPMWHSLVGKTILGFCGVTDSNEIVLSPIHVSNPFYVFYYNIKSKTIRRVEVQGMDGLVSRAVHTSVDHVEDMKLMEMPNTYNLRSCNSL